MINHGSRGNERIKQKNDFSFLKTVLIHVAKSIWPEAYDTRDMERQLKCTELWRVTRCSCVASINHTAEYLLIRAAVRGKPDNPPETGTRPLILRRPLTYQLVARNQLLEDSLIDAWTSHLSRKFSDRLPRFLEPRTGAFRRKWKCQRDKYSAFGLGQPGETRWLTFALQKTLEYYHRTTCEPIPDTRFVAYQWKRLSETET